MSNQHSGEESYEALKERARVLEEQLSAQEDMISRTTNYLEELQEQLKASNEQLAAYNEKLEEKVQERTKELDAKNKALTAEINAKKAYQHQLEQANKELNTLMYRASHDLRGPLTNAQGILELMIQTGEFKDSIPYLQETLDNMLRKVDTVHSIVYYQSLEEEPATIYLPETLEHVFEKAKTYNKNINAELSYDDSTLNHIHVQPQAFRLVILQLFINSLEFRDEGENQVEVNTSLKNQKEEWILKVGDNGPGMNEKISSELFEMFSRGEERKASIGLGLYQAKILMNKIGGTISLISSNANGTVFELKVPK